MEELMHIYKLHLVPFQDSPLCKCLPFLQIWSEFQGSTSSQPPVFENKTWNLAILLNRADSWGKKGGAGLTQRHKKSQRNPIIRA
jgi:hypothetical protein